MSTIRTSKSKDNPFVMIDNRVFKDTRLSWKAKGILGYLLSRPDDWVTRVDDLYKQSKDGRDSISSGLKELETCGYLVREFRKDEFGRFEGMDYVVHEEPVNGKPVDGIPADGEPSPINTKDNNTKETTNTVETNTSPKSVSHDKRGIFSSLLESETTKQDTSKPLEYREQKKLMEQKKKEEQEKNKQTLLEQYNLKMNSKDFNSFTYDDVVTYYEKKMQSRYGVVHKVTNSGKFKDALAIKVPEWGYSLEQVVTIIDIYIDNYSEFKGVDTRKYPIPKFPMNLITNPGLLAQVTSKPEFVSKHGPTSTTASTMNIKRDANEELIPILEKEWEEIQLKWMMHNGIVLEAGEKIDQQLVHWIGDFDIAMLFVKWVSRGYNKSLIKVGLQQKDRIWMNSQYEMMRYLEEERNGLLESLHVAHIPNWREEVNFFYVG